MSNIPLLLLPGLLNDARLCEAQISGLAGELTPGTIGVELQEMDETV